MQPSSSPSALPSKQPTEYLCPGDVVLLDEQGTQSSDVTPIQIVSSNSSIVTFAVSQVWVNGPVCFIATEFKSSDSGQMVCDRQDGIRPGEFETYAAVCEGGSANVTVYMYDASFETSDDATVPAYCNIDATEPGKRVAFTYSVQCPVTSEVCVQNSTDCSALSNLDLVSEAYESGSDAANWLFGSREGNVRDFTTFLGRLGQERQEVVRTILIPIDTMQVTLEFNAYEIDNWGSGSDNLYLRIGDEYIRVGDFSASENASWRGYFGDMLGSVETVGVQKHLVKITIPDSVYSSTWRLVIGFRVETGNTGSQTAAAGIDNVRIAASCEAMTQYPTASPSEYPSTTPSTQPTTHSSAFPSVHPTPSPSASPSIHGSDSPSVHPSFSPSAAVSMQPSSLPSAFPSKQPTEYDCPGDVVLLDAAGSQSSDVTPIDIISSNSSVVTFAVSQVWVNGPVCFVATEFRSSDSGQMVCDRQDGIRPGEFETYEAACEGGSANVTVYIYDASFGASDDATVPSYCNIDATESGRRVAFTYSVQCPVTSEVCVQNSTDCSALSNMELVSEAYESGSDAANWLFGSREGNVGDFTSFLGRLGQERQEVVRTILIPTDTMQVTLEFNAYEIDNWTTGSGKLYVRVGDEYISVGDFSSSENGSWRGYFGDMLGSVESFGAQKHLVRITIPASVYSSTWRLVIGFRVESSATDSGAVSAGIDNVIIAAACEAMTQYPTASPSIYPSMTPSSRPTTLSSGLPSAHPSLSPSASPSIYGSGSPSMAPSSSPSGAISVQPSSSPTALPSKQPTEYICPGDVVLVDEVGTQSSDVSPIDIISSNSSVVTFAVSQVWVNGPVCLVATEFKSSESGQMVCDRQDGIRPGEFETYAAVCEGGSANVTVYMYDSSFDGSDNAVVPDYCEIDAAEPGRRVSFMYSVQCPMTSEVCVQESSDCSALSNMELLSETYESSSEAGTWLFGNIESGAGDLTSFLGNLGPERQEVVRTIIIPTDTMQVALEFSVYEIDNWTPGSDKLYVRVGDEYVSVGISDASGVWRGYFGDMLGSVENVGDQKHLVRITIPASVYSSTWRLVIGFRVESTGSGAVGAGIDNVKIAASCEAMTQYPTASPSINPSMTPSSRPTTLSSGHPSVHPSLSPSASPSIYGSGSPSMAPSSSPSGAISMQPSSLPTSLPSKQPTEYICPGDVVLIDEVGTQSSDVSPIDIISSNSSVVTFAVSQVWVNGPVCFVATEFMSSDSGQMVCDRQDGIRPGEFETYAAVCEGGSANVTVYMYDSTFEGSDNAVVPDYCGIDATESGRRVSFTYSVQCPMTSEVCVQDSSDCSALSSMELLSETYDSTSEAGNWLFGSVEGTAGDFTPFLGRLSQAKQEVVRTILIPANTMYVTLEFSFYEIDNWTARSDKFYVRIGDDYVDLGNFVASEDEGTWQGSFGEMLGSVESVAAPRNIGFAANAPDQEHVVRITIPASVYGATWRLVVGFRADLSGDDVSAGMDNVKLTASCDALTQRPTAAPSLYPSSAPTARPSASSSDGPSAQPSILASVLPSAHPSHVPSVHPSSPPSEVPFECPGEVALVNTVGSQSSNVSPIDIISSNPSVVNFAVSQVWVNAPVCFIATEFNSADSGGMVCDRQDGIRPGEFETYSAVCEGGSATVTLYMYDDSFATSDTATVPDYCNIDATDPGKRVSFTYSIPCPTTPQDCIAQDVGDCSSLSSNVLLYEQFETPGEVDHWLFGSIEGTAGDFTPFLGRLGSGKEEVVRTILIPTDTMHVTLEFSFYEIDNWKADSDKFFVRIGDEYVNVGKFVASADEGTWQGYFGDMPGSVESVAAPRNIGFGAISDQEHVVRITVPASVYSSTWRLVIGFWALVSGDDVSAGMDNIKLTASCDALTQRPTAAPSLYPSGAPSARPTVLSSDGPSAQPSILASVLPSAHPSHAPSVHPSTSPSEVPFECPGEVVLVNSVGSLSSAVTPIDIISSNPSEVKFAVSQVWVNAPVCFVATDFKSSDSGQTVCDRQDGIRPGEFETYSAVCEGGSATVTLYMYDDSFATSDAATVPDRCNIDATDPGKRVSFTYTLPCPTTPQDCNVQAQDVGDCSSLSSDVLLFEQYETPGEVDNWLFGKSEGSSGDFTPFLGRLGSGREEVVRTILVPTDTRQLSLSFNFYEIDNWRPGVDMFYVRIGDIFIDIGEFGSDQDEGSWSGYLAGMAATVDRGGAPANVGFNSAYPDQKHSVHITIPDTWYSTDWRLVIGFRVDAGGEYRDVVSGGVDNVRITASCESNAARRDQADICGAPGEEDKDVVLANYDFENAEDAGDWVGGTVYHDDELETSLLGRLNKYNTETYRLFMVPTDAESMLFSFSFATIDGFGPGSKFYLRYQTSYIALDLSGTLGTPTTASSENSDIWYSASADSAHDNVLNVLVEILKAEYTTGELYLGFKMDADGTDSVAVDNIKLTAQCRTATGSSSVGRGLGAAAAGLKSLPVATNEELGIGADGGWQHKNDAPADEPSWDGDDGSYYCSAEDFPCEGAGSEKVYVCHYSQRDGYHTYCIPEADSEFLRFYSYDYCGPCVGGYGGIDLV